MTDDLFIVPRALAADVAARAALSTDLLRQRDALLEQIASLQVKLDTQTEDMIFLERRISRLAELAELAAKLAHWKPGSEKP